MSLLDPEISLMLLKFMDCNSAHTSPTPLAQGSPAKGCLSAPDLVQPKKPSEVVSQGE